MKPRFILLLALLILGLSSGGCISHSKLQERYAYKVEVRAYEQDHWQTFYCQHVETFVTEEHKATGVILEDCTGGPRLEYTWPQGVEPEVKITSLKGLGQ